MTFNLKPIGEHSYTWAEGLFLSHPDYKDGSRELDWDTIRNLIS